MIETTRALGPMVTSPHHLASQAGLDMLRQGGNAAEALVATLATLAVVYPHMTGLGGDGFWLLAPPGGGDPVAIDGAGRAGRRVSAGFYRERGLDAIPSRGPLSANTVPGAVASWISALAVAARWSGPDPRLPLEALLEPAIHYASAGVPVPRGLAEDCARLAGTLGCEPGFLDMFGPTAAGAPVRRPGLAATLRALAEEGLDGFYRGRLAHRIAADLVTVGAPVEYADLAFGHAAEVAALALRIGDLRLFNVPPPTQGLVSLLILGVADRRPAGDEAGGFAHVHGLVEATKRAFRVRDRVIGDPGAMTESPASFLADAWLDRAAAGIDAARALPWPEPDPDRGGDTVWCGAVDAEGGMASAINSLFHEFGSGVVLPETAITWQNRGTSFVLTPSGQPDGPRALAPVRKPFHTLNPAMAFFADGRRMAYGAMGGEGQPQTQAAVLTRYARFGVPLQEAVTAPRWLLGRTWGEDAMSLRVEADLGAATIDRLREAGHAVSLVPRLSAVMGHAGAIVSRPDGVREGASDPRSDGAVAAI